MSQIDTTAAQLPTAVPGSPLPALQSTAAAPSDEEEEVSDECFEYVSIPPTILGYVTATVHYIGELPPMPYPSDEEDWQDLEENDEHSS